MKKLKISSIFHWLYCSLLLAPCFAVGSACLNTAFQGTGIVSQESSKANVSLGQTQFEPDVFYFFAPSSFEHGKSAILEFTFSSSAYAEVYAYDSGFEYLYSSDFPSLSSAYINTDTGDDWNYLEFNEPSGDYFTGVCTIFALRSSVPFSMALTGQFVRDVDLLSLPLYLPVSYTEGNSDVFYSAVGKVASSQLFNWAEKSFLGQGFRYAGTWFGLPTDSPFYTYACYWCAISILWLIFDVLMYVPLLVHRWLDKGAIE